MRHYFSLIFLLICTSIYPQSLEYTTAPEKSSFNITPDNIGNIENNVNLFTGDAYIPLNLISLPGKNGLDVTVDIRYSSNVKPIIDTWNCEAPTSILGLGWSLEYPRIVADHKGTGARDDDDFYYFNGSKTLHLVCTGSESADVFLFAIEDDYDFSKVQYNKGNEYWTITKIDGTKYEFGNTNDSKQYLIKWGNWIISSSDPNQQRQACAWNLSKVENIWGDKVNYEYLNEEELVKNGTENYTKASYLNKITDSYNQTINFYYDDKLSNEYEDPHTESSEPDAYQEKFETKKLDYITIENENEKILSSLYFGYEFLAAGNMQKRLLSSITKKDRNGEILPGFKFAYNMDGTFKGHISQATYPYGGVVTYTYQENELPLTSRKVELSKVINSWDEVHAYFHEDYVVVTVGPKVYIYEWNGKWISSYILHLGLSEPVSISLQKDFFCLGVNGEDDKDLYVYTKDKEIPGRWNRQTFALDPSDTRYPDEIEMVWKVASGKQFIAVHSRQFIQLIGGFGTKAYVYFYVRKNNTWEKIEKYDADWDSFINNEDPFAMLAADNMLLTYHSVTGNSTAEMIHLKYSTLDKQWHSKDFTQIFNASEYYSSSITNKYATFVLDGNEQAVSWSEDYQNLSCTSITGTFDGSEIQNYSPLGAIHNKTVQDYSRFFRYSGSSWITTNDNFANEAIPANNYKYYSMGEDFITRYIKGQINSKVCYQYDPNNASWNYSIPMTGITGNIPVCGSGYFILYNENTRDNISTYFRQPNGSWLQAIDCSPGANLIKARTGLNYFIYQVGSIRDIPQSSYIRYIKNGTVTISTEDLVGESFLQSYWRQGGETIDLNATSGNMFITFNKNNIFDSDILYLHRVIDENSSDALTFSAVKSIDVNDGRATKSTTFDFFPSSGIADVSGRSAHYSQVRVIPGKDFTGDPVVYPNGFTEYYFINGNHLLLGSLKEKRIYDSANNFVGQTIYTWESIYKNISNETVYYNRIFETIESY